MSLALARRARQTLMTPVLLFCLATVGCDRQSPAALLGVETAQETLSDPAVYRRAIALESGAGFAHELSDGMRAFIFRDGRHIVVALDDDGDLPAEAPAPDGDSDCLAVDMDADGRIDRTIDYDDLDGDGRADRMVLTHADPNTWSQGPFMVVIRDLDRGPLSLWALRDYGYVQGLCQWDCDFGGDGWFCMFRPTRAGNRWAAALEAPFCFYDPDGDGLAEETVRLTAVDHTLCSARYSINADNDTTTGHHYDYDLSITCLGSVPLPAEAAVTLTHRSGATVGPFLSWETTRETVRTANWQRCLLIWDENDHNVAAREPVHERWEGIINCEYRGFPQEGGPPTPRLNRRFELDADYSGRMRLYWWPADGRLHLLGAEQGSLEADYDYDGRVDLAIEYTDRDGDGIFDERMISYPGTNLPSHHLSGGPIDPLTFDCSYAAIAAHWQGEPARWATDAAALLTALRTTADALGLRLYSAPLDFYREATPAQFAHIDRLRASDEARRYYQDLTIELACAHLLADARVDNVGEGERERIAAALSRYHAGDLRGAARVLKK